MSTTTSIHARALVEPGARLGAGTTVGPDAIIGPEVVTGNNCEIRARAILTGRVVMGDGNQVGYHAVIGAEPQDLSYRGAASGVRIGSGNVIRENATIHRGTKEGSETVVGDRCYLMAGAHVGHNSRLGHEVILVNNVLLGGYAEVGDHAFLGGGAVVHQFTRIGAHAILRGQTAMGQDVPPYAMAAYTNRLVGINRVGLRRRGFDEHRRRRIVAAFHVLYEEGLNRVQALEALESRREFDHPDIRLLADFVRDTRRGLCSFGGGGETSAE